MSTNKAKLVVDLDVCFANGQALKTSQWAIYDLLDKLLQHQNLRIILVTALPKTVENDDFMRRYGYDCLFHEIRWDASTSDFDGDTLKLVLALDGKNLTLYSKDASRSFGVGDVFEILEAIKPFLLAPTMSWSSYRYRHQRCR